MCISYRSNRQPLISSSTYDGPDDSSIDTKNTTNHNIEALNCDSSSVITSSIGCSSTSSRIQSLTSENMSQKFAKQSTHPSPPPPLIPSKTNLCLDLNIQTASEHRKVFTCQVPLTCPAGGESNFNNHLPFGAAAATSFPSEKY